MNDSSKELCKWSWDKVEMDGQSRPSKVTLHKKNLKSTISTPNYIGGTLCELTALSHCSIL